MKNTLSALFIAFLCYAGFGAFLYTSQYRLLYQPLTERISKADWGAADLMTVNVVTEDGLELNGWYSPSATSDYPVIVVFHGNGQHIGTTYKDRLDAFVREGYGIFMIEYRGHVGHKGKVTEEGLYKDARAFLAWLHDNQAVSYCDMIFYAESLGTALAVQMAIETPPRALVLMTPFSSFLQIAEDKYPYFPMKFMLKDQYRSDLKIAKLYVPLLVLHGKNDRILPLKYGNALFDLANEPKDFALYEEGGHTNLLDVGGRKAIVDFLNKKAGGCMESGRL